MPTFVVGAVLLAIATAVLGYPATRRRAIPAVDIAVVLVVVLCLFATALIFTYLFVIVAASFEQLGGP